MLFCIYWALVGVWSCVGWDPWLEWSRLVRRWVFNWLKSVISWGCGTGRIGCGGVGLRPNLYSTCLFIKIAIYLSRGDLFNLWVRRGVMGWSLIHIWPSYYTHLTILLNLLGTPSCTLQSTVTNFIIHYQSLIRSIFLYVLSISNESALIYLVAGQGGMDGWVCRWGSLPTHVGFVGSSP